MHRKHFIRKTAKGLMCYCTTAHVSLEYSSTDMTMQWENCILTDRVKALEDQMSARLTCWKVLFAAARRCVISVDQLEVASHIEYLGFNATSCQCCCVLDKQGLL